MKPVTPNLSTGASGGKVDRLQSVFAGRTPDRTPVALWRHWPGDDQHAGRLARATLGFQRRHDWDFVKLSPASNYAVAGWGDGSVRGDNAVGTREWLSRVVNREEDWLKLKPLAPDAGMQGEVLAAVDLVRAELGDTVPLVLTVFNPLAQAKYLAGAEVLRSHLDTAPEAVAAGLRAIAATTARFVEAAVERGIDGVFFAVQHATEDYFSEENYRKFGLATDLIALEPARACWCNLLHLHGDRPLFALAADYPVAAVNWHAVETGPPLAEAARLTDKALCGGLGVTVPLAEGSPADVQAAAMTARAEVDPARLILGAGCVLPLAVPEANINAVRAAVEAAAPSALKR